MGMSSGPRLKAIQNGPRNLVTAVDVSNPKCFTGNTATLINLGNSTINFTGGNQVNSDRIQGHYNAYYRTPTTNVLDTDYHSIFFRIRFNTSSSYPNAWSGGWDQLFEYDGGGDRVPGVWRFPTQRRIHWRYNPSNTGTDFGDNNTFPVNTWFFVGVTKNGSATRNYINGELHSTGSVSNPKTAGSSPIKILGTYSGERANLSSFNNLYVFNRVISDDEVRDLYQTMKVHMGMS